MLVVCSLAHKSFIFLYFMSGAMLRENQDRAPSEAIGEGLHFVVLQIRQWIACEI